MTCAKRKRGDGQGISLTAEDLAGLHLFPEKVCMLPSGSKISKTSNSKKPISLDTAPNGKTKRSAISLPSPATMRTQIERSPILPMLTSLQIKRPEPSTDQVATRKSRTKFTASPTWISNSGLCQLMCLTTNSVFTCSGPTRTTRPPLPSSITSDVIRHLIDIGISAGDENLRNGTVTLVGIFPSGGGPSPNGSATATNDCPGITSNTFSGSPESDRLGGFISLFGAAISCRTPPAIAKTTTNSRNIVFIITLRFSRSGTVVHLIDHNQMPKAKYSRLLRKFQRRHRL